MKIVFTCTYSAGISGVWNRVYSIAQELIKRGHQIYVFSSNLEAGTLKRVSEYENLDGINCYRFEVSRWLGSKNAFDFSKSAGMMRAALRKIRPDAVDCQTYRHSEASIISKESIKLGIPCFLTTHAPFVSTKVRGLKLSLVTSLYDLFFGKRALNRFKKIIAISRWEYPYLNRLGAENSRIVHIPNGIANEFFEKKIEKRTKARRILFFGRVAPVKDIETLIKAFKEIENYKEGLTLDIVGPAESEYRAKLDNLIAKLDVKNINFMPAVFEIKAKIGTYDEGDIFILPSKREGMPQSLIEAMARGRIVIASDIIACRELIKEGKNGFLFRQGDAQDLAAKLRETIGSYNKLGKTRQEAVRFAAGFKWSKIADQLERIYRR